MEEVGMTPTCPREGSSFEPPPAEECQDAPSFGSISGLGKLTCSKFVEQTIENSAKQGRPITKETVCDYASYLTLTALKDMEARSHVQYTPPSGYNPDTTHAAILCNSTCGDVGRGPCWLRGASQTWCEPVSDAAEVKTIVI